MSPAITKLELTDVNTISIPIDAIFIICLLIIFALIGYFFHNILNTRTNQFVEKLEENSNHEFIKEKVEDQLILESTTVNQEKIKKPNIKKLNYLSPSKLLGVGSMAFLAIGGASLLGIQALHNSNKGVNINQVNIKTKNQSAKTLVSMVKLKSSDKVQTKIKKISYVDPLFSTINSSKNNNLYQVEAEKTEDFFSF